MFNPDPVIGVHEIMPGKTCVVIDNALSNPRAWVEWAAGEAFRPANDFPYPGVVLEVSEVARQQVVEHCTRHARAPLGARRMLDASVRLSMVATPPAARPPVRLQNRTDGQVAPSEAIILIVMVIYLFANPALGGTNFYRPQQPDASSPGASERPPLLERVAQVPAAWNRAIYFDGGVFHSADLGAAAALGPDPRHGRLTLHGFFTCRRALA